MTVTLMPNLTRERSPEITQKLICELNKYNAQIRIITDDPHLLKSKENIELISNSEFINSPSVLVAIGGDGTMIKAAKLAFECDVPVLGVNAGNLAYLMELETDESLLIKKLIEKDFYIEERLVLSVKVADSNGNVIFDDYCINDAVFARAEEIKLCKFDLYCDNRLVNRYTADGIIISTPTGSTAYNLASGGPILDPRVDGIISTPICPHSLIERSVIFTDDATLMIKNPQQSSSKILFSVDGGESILFEENAFATINKVGKKAKFLRLSDASFMDILYNKMKFK